MALAVKHLLDLKQFNTLTDAGYSSGEQFAICKSAGIISYSAPMPTTAPSNKIIPTSEFTYIKEKDCYICPSGQTMKKIGNSTTRGNYIVFIYKTQACKTCPIRQECTSNKNGRVIERTEYQNIIDENTKRVLANPDYYKFRQQIIEHQFGILKRQWGFTFTIMKRKANVLSEVNLFMMIYNLRRSISIMGVEELKKKLKDFSASLFSCFETIWKRLAVFFENPQLNAIIPTSN